MMCGAKWPSRQPPRKPPGNPLRVPGGFTLRGTICVPYADTHHNRTIRTGTRPMLTTEHGKHIVYTFDSFTEFVDRQRATPNSHLNKALAKDARTAAWTTSFAGGVASVAEACDLAMTGLPKVGIEVLKGGKLKVDGLRAQIDAPSFVNVMDTAGAYVDMGRYLSGEPECMVNFALDRAPTVDTVIPIVVNMAVTGYVQPDDIAARGRAVVALIDAVQTSGRNIELWADMSSNGVRRQGGQDYMARFAIKIKAAEQPLDAATLMYAMTHASFFRALGFNMRHMLPPQYRRALDVGGGYGSTVKGAVEVERDYGPKAIYIAALRAREDHDATVNQVLREIGLLA